MINWDGTSNDAPDCEFEVIVATVSGLRAEAERIAELYFGPKYSVAGLTIGTAQPTGYLTFAQSVKHTPISWTAPCAAWAKRR